MCKLFILFFHKIYIMNENIKNKFEETNENKYLDLSNLDLDEIIFTDKNEEIECFIRKQDEQFNLSLQNKFCDIIYLFINDNKLNNINLNLYLILIFLNCVELNKMIVEVILLIIA